MQKYYSTISRLSKVNVILLVTLCVITMIVIWGYGWNYSLFDSSYKGSTINNAEIQQSIFFSAGTKVVQLILIFSQFIILLIWIYKFQKGLSFIAIKDAKWSPGWCVGFWFIPIINFFRPYQVIAQLWRATNPLSYSENWKLSTVPPLLMIWWIPYLVSKYGFSLSERMVSSFKDPQSWFFFQIILQAFVIISSVLLILIIRQITEQLREKITYLEEKPEIKESSITDPESKEKEIEDFKIVAKQKSLKDKPDTETLISKPSPPKIDIITKKKT